MERKKSNVFSMRLKVARKAKKLSQERLGILAGIDEASASARMNQYEKGKHAPDYQTMQLIAAELGLPVAYFYCDDELLAELICAISTLKKEEQELLLKKICEDNSDNKTIGI